MRAFVDLPRRSRWLSAPALALMTAAVAGCSAESNRFSENPYSSPYASKDSTSSVARAPSGKVESQPLSQPQNYWQALPPPPAVARPASVVSGGSSGGSGGMGSYQPQPIQASYAPSGGVEYTGSVAGRPQQSRWDFNGGTAIIVGPGE